MTEQKYRLLNNSRFYILAFSVLLSTAVFSWLRLQIPSDQLFYIRAEQVFGLLCVLYWYVALVISPIGYVIGKQRMRHIEFARRAIGVSAFYFALLHAVVALWGQLGGLGQVHYLPSLFKWSLLGGGIALGVLFIMAATSFDRVVRFMTFRWWKWLHRLVYAGGILAVLHIWTIGTHLAYTNVQLAALIALVVLSGLELFRVTTLLNRNYFHFAKPEAFTMFLSMWLVVVGLILVTPKFVHNYHSRHVSHEHAPASHNQGHHH
jgi:sulfoxide reductase heme-binding subunit YedZ